MNLKKSAIPVFLLIGSVLSLTQIAEASQLKGTVKSEIQAEDTSVVSMVCYGTSGQNKKQIGLHNGVGWANTPLGMFVMAVPILNCQSSSDEILFDVSTAHLNALGIETYTDRYVLTRQSTGALLEIHLDQNPMSKSSYECSFEKNVAFEDLGCPKQN